MREWVWFCFTKKSFRKQNKFNYISLGTYIYKGLLLLVLVNANNTTKTPLDIDTIQDIEAILPPSTTKEQVLSKPFQKLFAANVIPYNLCGIPRDFSNFLLNLYHIDINMFMDYIFVKLQKLCRIGSRQFTLTF